MDRRILALVSLSGLILSTLPARAQNALGDGRALDRTLSNQPASSQPDKKQQLEAQIRFNNRIITGDAGAGRSFRGSVGYRAAEDFRGTLGSDSLYNFKRETTAGAALAASGARTSDALRFQAGLTSGQGGSPASLALFSESRGNATTAEAISSMRSPSQYVARASYLPTVLGYTRVDSMGPLAMTASPLRGIGWVPLDPTYAATRSKQDNPDAPGAGGLTGVGVATPLGASANALGLSGMERTARGVVPAEESSGMRQARELRLLNQTGSSTFIDQRLDQRDDPYGKVMKAVRAGAAQKINDAGGGIGAPTLPVAPDAPGRTGPSTNPITPAPSTPAGPSSLPPGLTTPGGAPAESATGPAGTNKGPAVTAAPRPAWLEQLDALRAKLKNEQPSTKPPGDRNAPKRLDPRTGTLVADDSVAARPQLAPTDTPIIEVLRDAESKIDVLVPPGTTSADTYTKRMLEGQAALTDRRYFDAESAFTLAIVAKRNDVIAEVGRVHAQLGAGLFLSAAGNLRLLLADHPEIIQTRYGPELLPSVERGLTIANLISDDLSRPRSALGADGGLVLAYMGRQYMRPDWVARGLSEMRARVKPDDPAGEVLVSLLERTWGQAKP